MASKRDSYLKRRYEISEAEYDALLAEGEGRCWICGTPPVNRHLHLEHSHKIKPLRKSVRGIACWHCNTLLSKGRDDPAILRAAAEYLESNRAQEILDASTDKPEPPPGRKNRSRSGGRKRRL